MVGKGGYATEFKRVALGQAVYCQKKALSSNPLNTGTFKTVIRKGCYVVKRDVKIATGYSEVWFKVCYPCQK